MSDTPDPVGVQPEPAEDAPTQHQRSFMYDATCRQCNPGPRSYFATASTEDDAIPAVPVVHPEPGDRAEDEGKSMRQKVMRIVDATFAQERMTANATDAIMALHRHAFRAAVAQCEAEGDARVAAAVAAVRADLAREVRLRAEFKRNGNVHSSWLLDLLEDPS